MKFSKYVFIAAGVYGLIVTVPMYFSEGRFNTDYPPVLTHPEYFYGFIGVVTAWQIVFLLIARDPYRYQLIMIPAVIEKLSYGLAVIFLFWLGRVSHVALTFAFVDLGLAILFFIAFIKSRPSADFY